VSIDRTPTNVRDGKRPDGGSAPTGSAPDPRGQPRSGCPGCRSSSPNPRSGLPVRLPVPVQPRSGLPASRAARRRSTPVGLPAPVNPGRAAGRAAGAGPTPVGLPVPVQPRSGCRSGLPVRGRGCRSGLPVRGRAGGNPGRVPQVPVQPRSGCRSGLPVRARAGGNPGRVPPSGRGAGPDRLVRCRSANACDIAAAADSSKRPTAALET